MMRLFRNRADVGPVAVMLSIFVAQLLLLLTPVPVAWAMLGAVLLFPLQVNLAGMCHNHHHHHVFARPFPNRALEVVMFLQLGMLPYGYTLHHNLGHHCHYMDQRQDPNRWRRADGTAMGSWEFAFVLVLHMYPNVCAIGRRHPRVFRKFLRMAAVCTIVLGALVLLAPAKALVLFVAPLPLALLLQAQATHHQHVGLESREPLRASRSATSAFYNWRTCNLGYHTAHHLKPGLHWSKLPELHAQIARDLPRDLVV